MTHAEPVTGSRPALRRELGTFSAAAIAIGTMIGSGIFRVPGSVAAEVGTAGGIGLLWLVGGAIALCGAVCAAELAAMYPETGGEYVYLRESWGRLPAFLFGWTRLLVLVPASLGAIGLIFAAYFRSFLPVDASAERWIAIGAISVVMLLNYRSLLWSAAVENVMSAAKVAALLFVAVACMMLGDRSAGAFGTPAVLAPATWTGFGLALVTAMWSYSGWSSAAAMGGEVRDPTRTLPRALLLGVFTVIVVYLAINAAYLYVLPIEAMAASTLVAADAAAAVFGEAGRTLVAALVAISTFGALQALMMYNPRFFFAMAGDNLLFRRIGSVHTRFHTPHGATLLTAALALGYVWFRSFEQLAQAFILGVWPFHTLMVAAVFKLRREAPNRERPYRAWGYPLTPALFVTASIAMILVALVQRPGLTLFGFGVIVAGVPVYYRIDRRRSPEPT